MRTVRTKVYLQLRSGLYITASRALIDSIHIIKWMQRNNCIIEDAFTLPDGRVFVNYFCNDDFSRNRLEW